MKQYDFGTCPAVSFMPGRVSGAYTIGESRMPLYVLFDNIGDMTAEEFCNVAFATDTTPEQVQCVLDCLANWLRENRPGAQPRKGESK